MIPLARLAAAINFLRALLMALLTKAFYIDICFGFSPPPP